MSTHPALRVMLQLLAIGGWLTGVLLLWPRSLGAAMTLFAVGAVVIALGYRRQPGEQQPLPPEVAEKQARLIVTRMLGALTRVQVAYLSQAFDSGDEGRAWLRRTLPRSYRPMLDELYCDLEAARKGGQPAALELALRILALRPEIERAEAALRQALEGHPEHAVASPVIFVVTEHIDVTGDGNGEAPLVATLASLDPTQASLVAAVDTISLFVHEEGERKILGQTDFARVRRDLRLRRVKSVAGDVPVYVHTPAEGERPEIPVQRPPLGFVVGASEMV